MELASAAELADWLRANKDKRGTPDYQTVLRGFQEATIAEMRANAPTAPAAEPQKGALAALGKGLEGTASSIQTAAEATFGSPEEAARESRKLLLRRFE